MQTIYRVSLVQEVVALIRQLGPQNKLQLKVHLPQHELDKIQKALENAAHNRVLRSRGDGSYEYCAQTAEAAPTACDCEGIVERALRTRTLLELAWVTPPAPQNEGWGNWPARLAA